MAGSVVRMRARARERYAPRALRALISGGRNMPEGHELLNYIDGEGPGTQESTRGAKCQRANSTICQRGPPRDESSRGK